MFGKKKAKKEKTPKGKVEASSEAKMTKSSDKNSASTKACSK